MIVLIDREDCAQKETPRSQGSQGEEQIMQGDYCAIAPFRDTIKAGARNTYSVAVCAPTDERGFSTPELQACADSFSAGPDGFGRGAPIRKDGGMATDMLRTPCPPDARRKAEGGFSRTLVGAETMNRKSSLSLHDLQGIVELCARAAEANRILQELDKAERVGLLSQTTLGELNALIYARKSWQELPDTMGEVLHALAYELGLHAEQEA